MPAPLLTVANLAYAEHGQPILHPLSFAQRTGQKLAVAGESGTGKSTLLQLIAGLIQPSAGEIFAAGRRVQGPADVLTPGHPGVAYLSQKSDLPHSLRVEQVLRYASQRPPAEAQALFELCRIGHLLLRRTNQLSGGEQQRVALARLLLGSPRLLLLDEPFSNLDRAHKRTMQQIVEDVSTRLGITVLLVSHDAADVLPWADEILVLHRGRAVQQGPPELIYRQPVSEYVAGLFGDYNLVRGAARRTLQPHGPQRRGTALLLRPEELVLQTAGNGLPGVVRAVRFGGGFYEAEVVANKGVLRVRVGSNDLAPGTEVAVAVAAEAGWPVATTQARQ